MHFDKPFLVILAAALAGALATSSARAVDKEKPEKKKKQDASQDAAPKEHPTGYTDTPFLPGNKWRVHDDNRPRPAVVTPGTGTKPPSDAIVLFGGGDLSQWERADGSAVDWVVGDGYMEVPPRKAKEAKGDIFTKRKFGDCQLHVEWAAPSEIVGKSQGRGNSGVFFADGLYELQVLDSFNNKTYADGQASALYGWKPPLVNASRKPGEWQTYDVIFEAPRFDQDGKLLKEAYITVLHNGVVTQHRQPYLGATGHKKVAEYKAHPSEGRIKLQDHSNPIRFRNIWIRELDLTSND